MEVGESLEPLGAMIGSQEEEEKDYSWFFYYVSWSGIYVLVIFTATLENLHGRKYVPEVLSNVPRATQ
jgi:hypothetical protein